MNKYLVLVALSAATSVPLLASSAEENDNPPRAERVGSVYDDTRDREIRNMLDTMIGVKIQGRADIVHVPISPGLTMDGLKQLIQDATGINAGDFHVRSAAGHIFSEGLSLNIYRYCQTDICHGWGLEDYQFKVFLDPNVYPNLWPSRRNNN
jgi:hypothetical protein